MPRVKGGTVARKRRKKILKLAKGYYGSKHTLYKTAHEQVMHSLQYAYRDRKQRKRNFRKLWITRINAAARFSGLSYSKFMHGLKLAGVEVDRKVLADLAVHNPDAFANLAETSKTALASGKAPVAKSADKKVVAKPAAKKQPADKKVVDEKPATEKKAEKKPAEKKAAPKKAAEKKPVAKNDDLSSKSVAELKEIAKSKGITGYSKLKKAELLEVLK